VYYIYTFERTHSLWGSVVFCLLASGAGCTSPPSGGKSGVAVTTLNTWTGSSAVILFHLRQNDSVKQRDLNLLTKIKRKLASVQAAFGQCCYRGKWEPNQQN